MHEAAQTAITSSEEVTPGGANDCTINIVTLHNIWRLTRCRTATDSGDRDSIGLYVDDHDLFMISDRSAEQLARAGHWLLINKLCSL